MQIRETYAKRRYGGRAGGERGASGGLWERAGLSGAQEKGLEKSRKSLQKRREEEQTLARLSAFAPERNITKMSGLPGRPLPHAEGRKMFISTQLAQTGHLLASTLTGYDQSLSFLHTNLTNDPTDQTRRTPNARCKTCCCYRPLSCLFISGAANATVTHLRQSGRLCSRTAL